MRALVMLGIPLLLIVVTTLIVRRRRGPDGSDGWGDQAWKDHNQRNSALDDAGYMQNRNNGGMGNNGMTGGF